MKSFLARLRHRLRPRPALVYYVADGQGWSFDQDALYLTSGLSRHGLKTEVGTNPWRSRGAIVQFGNRYAFRARKLKRFARTNRIFLTWFHGDPLEAGFRELFDPVSRSVSTLERIVVPCTTTEKVLIRAGLPQAKIAKIPLGVDTGLFRAVEPHERRMLREELDLPQDAVCIGSFQKDGVGWAEGLEPKHIKGPDVLVEVLAGLHRRDRRIVAVLTGPARGFVRAGLERAGVPYRHFAFQDYAKVARVVRSVDLCLITSRCEGGPKALLESWASGVPVVSTRVGMAADLIRSGENGVLAEVDDVATLVDQASTLVAEAALRQELGEAGHKESARFDWSQIADEYFQLYFPRRRCDGAAF